jgi:Domain of unknown function (DUF4349)
MRLSDIGPGRDEGPVPAEVEAELAALDAALAGDDVPAGMEGLEALVGDLRAERAAPDTEFGEALDRWAAAGFPRGRRPGLSRRATKSDAYGRTRVLLQSLTPRRLAYAGGAAATLVVLVVAVSQLDLTTSDIGDDMDDSGGGAETLEAPAVQPEPSDEGADFEDGASTGPVPEALEDQAAQGALRNALGEARVGKDPDAGAEDPRKVERDAQMTLAAPADEVQDVTNEAISVIDANRGIVERSQSSGTDESARALLELSVPTRLLDQTLDQLADLADVKSLSEGSVDITRPFVDAKDELAGLRAVRESLFNQIEAATSQEELDELRARLDVVQRQIAVAKADFQNIQDRAQRSDVTLQITSDGADEGDWSLEDALDDAGRVLTVGAGIALITAAVVLPLALIGAVIYFLVSAARNRSRERALDS